MTVTTTNTKPIQLRPTQFHAPLTDAADGGRDYELTDVFAETLMRDWIVKDDPAKPVALTWQPPATDTGPAAPVQLTPNSVVGALAAACDVTMPPTPAVDHAALDIVASLTNTDLTSLLPVTRKMFIASAMHDVGYPAPVPGRVIYTVESDVRTAARVYCQAREAKDHYETAIQANALTASLGLIYSPATLGVWCADEAAFDDFKKYLDYKVNQYAAQDLLTAETVVRFRKFNQVKLDKLTTSLRLRTSEKEATGSYSFARVFMHILHEYITHTESITTSRSVCPEIGFMAFDVNELIMPSSIVFANIEAHASHETYLIDAEWRAIVGALQTPIKRISLTEITSLTSDLNQQRRAQKSMTGGGSSNDTPTKRVFTNQDFDTSPPTAARIAKDVMAVLEHMGKVNTSKNIHKYRKKTFNKQSRRHPDNPNMPGRTKMKRYYPDVHIYADTSGSIQPDEYEAAIKIIAVLAKKLGFNIYFSSFTHVLSEEVELHTKGRSPASIMSIIHAIPKMKGNTDFELVWRNINQDFAHRSRCNIVISDMEYTPDRYWQFQHPNSTYYIPIVTNQYKWPMITRSVATFCTNMQDFVPDIRNRILGA